MTSLPKSEFNDDKCSTCLTRETELFCVFDEFLENETLDSVFEITMGIKFVAGEGLPSMVCRECSDKAAKKYFFMNWNKTNEVLQDNSAENSELNCEVKSKVNVTEKTANEPQAVDVKTENDHPAETPDSDQYKNLPGTSKDESPTNQGDASGDSRSSVNPVRAVTFNNTADLVRHLSKRYADAIRAFHRSRYSIARHQTEDVETENDHQAETPNESSDLEYNLPVPAPFKDEAQSSENKKMLSCMQCKKMYLKNEDFDQHCCGNSIDTDQKQEI